MPLQSTADAFYRFRENSVAWKLMRSRDAVLTLTILGSHFNQETSEIPKKDFEYIIDNDLKMLAQMPTIFSDEFKGAEEYCTLWYKEGYIEYDTEPGDNARVLCKLASQVRLLISFINQLVWENRQDATKTRGAIIFDLIEGLSNDIDPDKQKLLTTLYRQRAEIDEKIKRVENGELPHPTEEDILERAREIIYLGQDMFNDVFTWYERLEEIARNVHCKISDEDALDSMFAGVSELENSSFGKTMSRLMNFLSNDIDRNVAEENINTILDSKESYSLKQQERDFLFDFIADIRDEVVKANRRRKRLSDGINSVVSQKRIVGELVFRQQLDEAIDLICKMTEVIPDRQDLDFCLQKPGFSSNTISRWGLRPYSESRTAESVSIEEETSTALSADEVRMLTRDSDIDLKTIKSLINAELKRWMQDEELPDSDIEPLPLYVVYAKHSKLHTFTNIIGLILVALESGIQLEGNDDLCWEEDGVIYGTKVERFGFLQEVEQ